MLAFKITGADAAGLGLDDDIVIPAFRRGIGALKPVIGLAVGDQGLHGFWIIAHTNSSIT
jgi:hypothetical protein